ncbi:MAG: winged helix-turn-helix transcriptional regulator [Gammaproteobacteria bacterium]|nr:winged helix-turn-helix transcriptional regulator [Gammaproteobacteria bacterium]
MRVLKIMEYLMAADDAPVKQIQIARDLNLSPATVSRIVRALADEGYVMLTSEKYCVRNFRLSRNVPMSELYLSHLNQLMQDLSAEHGVSVEAVVVTGFELFWHSCTEFPDANVAIKAKPGFRRTLAELDPLARLYLSRLSWNDINSALLPAGFFRNDITRAIIDAAEAKQIITQAKDRVVDFDFDGNHLGVRRFATIIDDDEGRFMHLLSIAEAATPAPDRDEHIARFTEVLSDARAALKAHITNETASQSGANIHALSVSRTG